MCPRTSGRALERLIFVGASGDAFWAVVDVGTGAGLEASVRVVGPDCRRWSAWLEMGASERDCASRSSSASERGIVVIVDTVSDGSLTVSFS